MKLIAKTVLCAAAALALAAPAAAGPDEELVARLAEGQARLEAVCGRCHSVDTPLSREMDRASWDALMIDMTERGAELGPGDKEAIVSFLVARYVFSKKCTVCHAKERILDRERAYAEWKSTVEKMAAKSPDLMSPDDARLIVAYLTMVLGPAGEGR